MIHTWGLFQWLNINIHYSMDGQDLKSNQHILRLSLARTIHIGAEISKGSMLPETWEIAAKPLLMIPYTMYHGICQHLH